MKRVLLDCDGVLADFTSAMLQLVNVFCATTFTPADVTEFDFAKALKLDRGHAAAVKSAIGGSPMFAANLAVYPGAVEGVRKLREVAEVYIVTSPWNSNPTWTHDRETWLKRHFDIPHQRVIHTSAKHVCAGDVFVDDKTSTLVEWCEHQRAGIAVQWQTLHNRRDQWHGFSTCDWGELAKLVESKR